MFSPTAQGIALLDYAAEEALIEFSNEFLGVKKSMKRISALNRFFFILIVFSWKETETPVVLEKEMKKQPPKEKQNDLNEDLTISSFEHSGEEAESESISSISTPGGNAGTDSWDEDYSETPSRKRKRTKGSTR